MYFCSLKEHAKNVINEENQSGYVNFESISMENYCLIQKVNRKGNKSDCFNIRLKF